jgi:hypothetical protein
MAGSESFLCTMRIQVVDTCECSNEPSGSIKYRDLELFRVDWHWSHLAFCAVDSGDKAARECKVAECVWCGA